MPPLRILLLEDDPHDAELAHHELVRGGLGFTMERVEDEATFRQALERPPDLILADYHLPAFSGPEALTIALEVTPSVPFIFVSGTLGEEAAVDCLKLGATDYVLKDRIARLVPAVVRALHDVEAERMRLELEAEVREAQERYRTIVEQLPAITYVDTYFEGRGGLLYVSPQAEAILGYPVSDWSNEPDFWWNHTHPADRGSVDEADRAARAGGSAFEAEYRMIARDGRVVWFHDSATVFPGAGEHPVSVHGVMLDVTPRKEAEEGLEVSRQALRRADAERLRLLSRLVRAQEDERRSIANDLHDDPVQAMTAVAMRLSMLGRWLGDDPQGHEDLRRTEETVHLAIDRLRHLLFELHPMSLEREGLAAALRDQLRYTYGEEGSDIESRVTDELVAEPPTETRTILYRLCQEALANVRKHAAATTLELTLRTADDGVEVTVRDDGVGFDPSMVRADEPGHLGIGSMIERAQLAGGWCRIDSAPGMGTTVAFWIPSIPPATS